MNTGRNLNIVSWAVVVYLLSGADIQSLGISGVVLKVEYPGVIKLAVLVLWVWMLLTHWMMGRKGDYYRAWVDNAMDKGHPGINQTDVESECGGSSEKLIDDKLAAISKYFGKTIQHRRVNTEYELAYLNDVKSPHGVYVVQKGQRLADDSGPGERRFVTTYRAVTERYSIAHLHWRFRDVFWRVTRNNADVFIQRVVPWTSASIAVALITANYVTDITAWSAILFERPLRSTPP